MPRRFSRIAVGFLIIWQLACGGGTLKQSSNSNSSGTPSANISISPGSSMVGGPDLTLTVSGSKNFTFSSAAHKFSQVVWSQGGIDTSLLTTFVSSSQLTAILPAPLLASAVTAKMRVETKLLQSPTSVQIVVMNGDVMGMSDGYFGYPRSNSVTFTVGP